MNISMNIHEDLTTLGLSENGGTLYSVEKVIRCWIPAGYTLEVIHNANCVIVRFEGEVIASVKSIAAAKTKVFQHVPRQFRTRIEHTWSGYNKQGVWEDRFYPQYYADGRWHALVNKNGTKKFFPKEGEAKIELLTWLGKQERQEAKQAA